MTGLPSSAGWRLTPEQHAEYRAWELDDRKRLAVPILGLGALLIVVLGVLDLQYFDGSRLGPAAVAVRVVLGLVTVAGALAVHRTPSPGAVDAWLFGWSMLLVTALGVRHFVAADQGMEHHALDVALVLLWLLLPNPTRLQIIPAAVTATTGLATAWGEPMQLGLPVAYGLALAAGLVVAFERSSIARGRFLALKEVRTLRGIIPICAWCRQVRDDEGYWGRVEEYLSRHTDARFSHGVCPSCSERVEARDADPEARPTGSGAGLVPR